MTIDLSKSTDPDIQLAATVLSHLGTLMAERGIDFLVVGATARNIMSIGVFGDRPDRATRDVDIAVEVENWHDVSQLATIMPAVGRSGHRFEVLGVNVDVIPCGAIENDDRTVDLPNDFRLNTLGFREAFATAESVTLHGGLIIRIPSMAAQALLKLVAWFDRRWDSRKDAIDLGVMTGWYSTGRYLDELYESYMDLLASHDFDVALAGAHRLGLEIAGFLGPDALANVQLRIADHQALESLANATNGPFEQQYQRITAMCHGIRGGRSSGVG